MGLHSFPHFFALILRPLAFVLLLNSLPLKALAQSGECKNGACAEKLIERLEDLGTLYRQQCLPKKELSEAALKSFHEQYGVPQECWRLMTEISHLEDELHRQQSSLEVELAECKDMGLPGEELTSDLGELSRIEAELSCSEQKRKEVRSKCGDDLKCVLMASALGLGGYVAEKLIPDNYKMKDCHLGDDSCTTQLATAFLKAVVSFFEGAWDLLKAGGKYVGKKAGDLWDWVSGADDHASTSQLALAKASEEQGVFDMLVKDFPGTITKIFSGLVGALKEWFKTDVFCQKWSGAPHFSTCERPTENFECLPCKTMVTGLCSLTGTLVAEIIPAFLTGGMVTAAKHGVNGASKIAKVFKVSDKAMKALKASRVGKHALEATAKLDKVLKISKAMKATKAAITAALAAIKAYSLSPARKLIRASHGVLVELTTKGKVFLAQTSTGKLIVFSAKAARATGKAIIYPIDNPMTTWAFKAGERSFEKVFRLGAPRLAPTGAVTGLIIESGPELEKAMAKLEAMRLSGKSGAAKLLEEEEKVLGLLRPSRGSIADEALALEKPDLDEVISHLFPELHYGPLAKKLGPEEVLKAEAELLEHIKKLPEGPNKEKLLKQFHDRTAPGVARNKVLGTNEVTSALVPHQGIQLVADAKVSPEKLEALNLFIEKARNKGIEINQEFMEDLNRIHLTGVSKTKGLDPKKGKEMLSFLKKYPKVKRQDLLTLAQKEVLGSPAAVLDDAVAGAPKKELSVVPKQISAETKRAHFTSRYGIESSREVEALGLPTSANNRAYLSLHRKADEKVVVFNSEMTVLKDGNDILGREAMTAAENMYQEVFMDVLRHDEGAGLLWKSMSRTDKGLLRELKLAVPPDTQASLLKALRAKAAPPSTLSLTQERLLQKLEAKGSVVLTAEETALLYRMFPEEARNLFAPANQQQLSQFKLMVDEAGKAGALTESEKLLQKRLTKATQDKTTLNLSAEEVSILDGMSTRIYSGFKSIEGAVDWDAYKLALADKLDVHPAGLSDATVAEHLKADLAKLDQEVKGRFSLRMGELGHDLSKSKGKMSGHRIKDFSQWKAMGVSKIPPGGAGSPVDEAAMAARAARGKGAKGVSTYDDALSSVVVSKVRAVEGTSSAPGLRGQFLNSLAARGISKEKLIEAGVYVPIPEHFLVSQGFKGPRPQYVVSEKVWAVVRKSDDADEIAQRLSALFPGLKLTKAEARLLRSHYEALDALSPAIHAEARGALPVSLGLRKGGVLDVQGLGALNAQWNDAASMVSSLNGKTDDASAIISASRSAEVTGSTPAYKKRVDSMVQTLEDELGPGWVVRVSGDDVIFYPGSRNVPDRRGLPSGGRRTVSGTDPPVGALEDISSKDVNSVVLGLDRLAKKGLGNMDYGGSSLSRATFVRGEGAKEAHITMLENMEKGLRKNLEANVANGGISLDDLSSTVIGFDATVGKDGSGIIRVVLPKDSLITSEMLSQHLKVDPKFKLQIDRVSP